MRGRRRQRVGAWRAGATAAVLAAVGCADARRPGDEASSKAPAASGDTVASSSATPWSIEPTVVEATAVPPVTLADVRAAVQPDGGARLVFEIDGAAAPGYTVRYLDEPPTACGSGAPVPMRGAAVLSIRLAPAQAHAASDGEQRPTVADRDRTTSGGAIRQLTQTCDFEGVVTWVAGVDARRPYRVFVLAAPTRIVIDLRSDADAS